MSNMGNTKGNFGGIAVVVPTVLGLVAAVLYLIFGITSGTFVASILVFMVAAIVLGGAAIIYKGFFADFIPLAFTGLFTASLMQFAGNSIDDVTAFFVGMGNYFGNADNVGFRVVIAVAMVATIVTSIVGAFLEREKKLA